MCIFKDKRYLRCFVFINIDKLIVWSKMKNLELKKTKNEKKIINNEKYLGCAAPSENQNF